MEIRSATFEDFPAIRALIAKFPETLIQDHLPEPEEFFVATENGEIVGCCALEVYSQRLAEVRSLAVSPEMQGKGIASQLVDSCIEGARRLKIYEILAITGVSSMFEKKGFSAFNKEKFALFKILQ